MTRYEQVRAALATAPRRWCVTGAAGFIGSHLVEALLTLHQDVVGLDNFATGRRANLDEVLGRVGEGCAERFRFVEGDIRDRAACEDAFAGVERILHQAALGSVPRSLSDPLTSHDVNVTGFMNVMIAARDAGAKRVVYASSSSVYGDHPQLPKHEDVIGKPLSPYAVTKLSDELYADVFARAYGIALIGLRYFNVFGPRQDPQGPYAAVMPRWFAALLGDREVVINGDGETSRDFCYVANVVQANILAATTEDERALGRVYNVACGERTTLNELFAAIRSQVTRFHPECARAVPRYAPFRPGDIRHSLASVDRAREFLGYEPTHLVREGLAEAADWYAAVLQPNT
jgi:UDP-N-acetylglucosamine/UDP-N-acetylgalactosamine 4-epimerase